MSRSSRAAEPVGLLPLSQRKRRLRSTCCRTSSCATASAAKRRRRHQLHHGGGEPFLPRCGALSRTAREHARAGRRAQRREPAAFAHPVAQPRRGALLLRSALLAQGCAGARVYEKPQDHAAQCNEFRPRRIGGRVGRLTDRDAEKRAMATASCLPRVLPSAAKTAGCTTNSASASSSPSSTCAAMCWALAGASSARTIRARSI